MKQLLDELLELSRVGQVIGKASTVSLNDLAREVTEALTAPISARGVTVDVAEGLPLVRGDHVRLRQVLQNLLENAVKFMGTQPEPRVEIGARYENGQVLCWG